MAAQILHSNHSIPIPPHPSKPSKTTEKYLLPPSQQYQRSPQFPVVSVQQRSKSSLSVLRCSSENQTPQTLRTCKNCKTQFDPSLNHPRACRYHSAHFGGETRRKFESVHTGGTMDTPGSGKVVQYWHCCGSEDPFDPGCTAAPHSSYDD